MRGSVVVMEKTLLLVASTTSGFELEAAAARQDNALLLTLQNEIKRSRHTDLNSLIQRSHNSAFHQLVYSMEKAGRVRKFIYHVSTKTGINCTVQNKKNKQATFCAVFDKLNLQYTYQEHIRMGG